MQQIVYAGFTKEVVKFTKHRIYHALPRFLILDLLQMR